jgi:hypothetical protein
MKKLFVLTSLLTSSLFAEMEFEIECSALYLQPSESNLPYAVVANSSAISPHWKIHEIKPGYNWGLDAKVGMLLPSSTEASLSYTHFDSKNRSMITAGTNEFVGPFFEIGPDTSAFTIAKGRTTFKFDAAHIQYGIAMDFGCALSTNFFCGVGFARIDQKITNFYSNADASISRKIKTPSSFIGTGPELGVDFACDIYDGLQVVGAGSGALLVGSLRNHTSFDSVSPLLASSNLQSTHVRSKTGVVPGFDGKVGFAYTFMLGDCFFSLDAGYRVMYYLNAIQSVDIGSEVVSPPVIPDTIGVYARTFQRTVSHFSLAGPYFTCNVIF